MSNNNSRSIHVRAMRDADAAVVAKIWREGLAQTAEAAPWWLRPVMAYLMERYGTQALQPNGDVGPKGQNLMQQWNHPEQEHRRRMFVACLLVSNSSTNEADQQSQQDESESSTVVVGVVGVKKGFNSEMDNNDSDDENDNEDMASIWRMSVDASVRRQGVGLALMEHAEDWARQQGCTRMKLVTANAIAAQFYIQKAGYAVEEQLDNENENNEPSLSWWDRLRQPGRAMNLVHFYVKNL